mgnify:FL=1
MILKVLVRAQHAILELSFTNSLNRCNDIDWLPFTLFLDGPLPFGLIKVNSIQNWVINTLIFRNINEVAIFISLQIDEAEFLTNLSTLTALPG